ncbi:thioesterase-like superfamily-domain-containing protein [Phaeosphaeria sp. MPI-PUGE-AT-0046c]|nr:thioesterase-like superfamily-domain-containing protein [Phaeosphaeria sp. MPI-PUGE-AT-0046c]
MELDILGFNSASFGSKTMTTSSRLSILTLPFPLHCATMRLLARRAALFRSPVIFKISPVVRPYSSAPATSTLPPRWLSDVRSRIGKCIMFGISPTQASEAGSILQEISRDWRELVAGSEGYLTGEGRRGLYKQEVVWGEMVCDSIGHVNNVMYTRYAESARCNWTRNFAAMDPAHAKQWMELITPKSVGLILRSIKTDYKFPMKWPDRITVLHKLRNKPTTESDHFVLDVLILSELHRRPAARCVEDIVVYDYTQAKKSALPSFMIERFKETFAMQETVKEECGKRVEGILERVRRLEKESWDREGAVEDLGSAR